MKQCVHAMMWQVKLTYKCGRTQVDACCSACVTFPERRHAWRMRGQHCTVQKLCCDVIPALPLPVRKEESGHCEEGGASTPHTAP